jgi:NADPH-dependent curcumin reductase CurA
MADKRLGHEIHLKQRPVAFPTEDDFEFVRVSVPAPREGGLTSWPELELDAINTLVSLRIKI